MRSVPMDPMDLWEWGCWKNAVGYGVGMRHASQDTQSHDARDPNLRDGSGSLLDGDTRAPVDSAAICAHRSVHFG